MLAASWVEDFGGSMPGTVSSFPNRPARRVKTRRGGPCVTRMPHYMRRAGGLVRRRPAQHLLRGHLHSFDAPPGGRCKPRGGSHESRTLHRACARLFASGANHRHAGGAPAVHARTHSESSSGRSGGPRRGADRPGRRRRAPSSPRDRRLDRQAAEGLRRSRAAAGHARPDASVRYRRESGRQGRRLVCDRRASVVGSRGREGLRGVENSRPRRRHRVRAERRHQQPAPGAHRRLGHRRKRLRGAEEICARSHRGGPRRQARPGDRAR